MEKTRTDLQSEKMKNNQLNENASSLNNDISKLKLKCQFLEEKSEKEQSNLNDRILSLDSQLKDTENQVQKVTNNYQALKQTEK